MLSAQITNTSFVTQPVTILVTSNRELPTPNFESLYVSSSFITGSTSIGFLSGSFASASALLTYNRQFLRKEVAAYTSFQNNLSETPFTFISTYFENNVLDATDAIAYDLKNNKTIRTNKAAKAYFDKNGVSLIDSTEYSASLEALDYLNTLAQQVIKNQSVTGSSNVARLYQSAVTQSIISEFTSSLSDITGSGFIITNLIKTIKNTIESPILIAQSPVQLVTNVTIPEADSLSPVVAGKLVLEEGYGFIVSGSPQLTVVLSLLESANE